MKPTLNNIDKTDEKDATSSSLTNLSSNNTFTWNNSENNLVNRYSNSPSLFGGINNNYKCKNNCTVEEGNCSNCRGISSGYSNQALDLSDENSLPKCFNDKISSEDDYDQEITWTDFNIRKNSFNTTKLIKRIGRNCSKSAKHFSLKDQLLTMFPLFEKLRNYSFKTDLILDLICGVTISILHVPQGIAYSFLIGIPPVYGLYTSFFPVLIYSFLGTSSHISVGTMSVLDMMLSQVVKNYHSLNYDKYVTSHGTLKSNESIKVIPAELYSYDLDCSAIQLLVILCFLVGLFQIIMGIFQMGAISIILSDRLVSGFSCGAAVHVVVSQIPSVLEIHAKKIESSPFAVFYSAMDIAKNAHFMKLPSLILSIIVFIVIMGYRQILEKRVKKHFSLPVPIDLIVIIFSTSFSYFLSIKDNYNVTIMGKIPTGLPPPELPLLHLATRKDILLDSLMLSLVSYASALSLSKMYAKKHNYTIRANQEFFALGVSNLVSSFFSCFPATASLSRASVMGSLAKTQVASLISCCILLMILLILAPVLTFLPKCVVAVIIICAQKSLLSQCMEFPKAWKISRYEGLIWLVTFVSVVCFGIDIGLIAGAIFSVITIVMRFYHPKLRLLGQLPYTEIYLDIRQHRAVKEIPGIKIIQFSSPLFFMNKDMFQEQILKRTLKNQVFKGCIEGCDYGPVSVLILDCSAMSFIDTNGVEAIAEMSNKLQQANIQVCLAALAPPVISMLTRIKFFEQSPYTTIYPSVHEAVLKSDTPLLSRKLTIVEN